MKRFTIVCILLVALGGCSQVPLPHPDKQPILDHPTIGAPSAVFYYWYSTASPNVFYDKKDPDTSIVIRTDDMDKVNYISVASVHQWTQDATVAYCNRFLPRGATVLDQAGNTTEYTSSIGRFQVEIVTPGACVLDKDG